MSDVDAVYAEFDAAALALRGLGLVNHYAYLGWSAQERLTFDRMRDAAQERWNRAYDAKRKLIEQGRSIA